MTAKTDRERQQALRKRRAAQGLVELRLWVRPADAPVLRDVAETLAQTRRSEFELAHPDQLAFKDLE